VKLFFPSKKIKIFKAPNGQGITEFIIVVALIAVAAILVTILFGDNIRKQFAKSGNAVGGKKTSDVTETKAVTKEADEKDLSDFADKGSQELSPAPSPQPMASLLPPSPPPPAPPPPPHETAAVHMYFSDAANQTLTYVVTGSDGYTETGTCVTDAHGEVTVLLPTHGVGEIYQAKFTCGTWASDVFAQLVY
jgi:type IV pilus assembly protein PilA